MVDAVKIDLRYLSREPDRHGNDRLYVRRYGRRIRLRLDPDKKGFAAAYEDALARLGEPAALPPSGPRIAWPKSSFGWLAAKYFASDEFLRGIDPGSQRTRRLVIESCLAEPHTVDDPEPMGDCPLAYLTPKKIKRLRDLKPGKPGAANNRRKYLSAMFGWAIEAEYLSSNPARDVRRKKYATNGFYTWTLRDVRQFQERHPIGTKAMLALALLLFTGSRKGDVVRFGPEMVQSGVLKFVPRKTRHLRTVESVKPILQPLADIIARSPVGTGTYLETSFGRPFTAKGFGNWFRDRCNEAGLPKCTAHGLRKAGATMAAENGATAHQLMAIFDWTSPQQAETYTRTASRRKLTADAMHLIMPTGLRPGGLH